MRKRILGIVIAALMITALLSLGNIISKTLAEAASAPTAPIVTTPNGGETIDDSVEIRWNAATDPEQEESELRYEIDYASNVSAGEAQNTHFTLANGLLQNDKVNDIYVYDTSEDSIDSAWRYDSAKSWYSEPASQTRGERREFPEKAYLIATDEGLDIIDAVDNSLWMRFKANISGDYNMLFGPKSVFALNGKIYASTYGAGLTVIDFINDSGIRYHSDTANGYFYENKGIGTHFDNGEYGSISQRNVGYGWENDNALPNIVSCNVNDVHAAAVNGSTYIAVATDDGVSIVNEGAGRVINYLPPSSNYKMGKVFITNNDVLYEVLTRTAYDGNPAGEVYWSIL